MASDGCLHSNAFVSSKEVSVISSENGSEREGLSMALAMPLIAARPDPKAMVGWSVRLATRASHSAAETLKKTQAALAPRGSIASLTK